MSPAFNASYFQSLTTCARLNNSHKMLFYISNYNKTNKIEKIDKIFKITFRETKATKRNTPLTHLNGPKGHYVEQLKPIVM